MDVAVVPDGTPGVGQSTSLASAYVSGVVTALRSYRPDLDVAQTEALLRSSAASRPGGTDAERRRSLPRSRSGRARRRIPTAVDGGHPGLRPMRSPPSRLLAAAARERSAPRAAHRDPSEAVPARASRSRAGKGAPRPAHPVQDHSSQDASLERRHHPLQRPWPTALRPVADPAVESAMRRSALIGVLVLAATSVAPPARAGTYDVVSCGSGGGVNHAWRSFNEDAASLATGTRCSPLSGGAESGLFAVDRIPGPPNAAKGRGTGWRITAPAGTRITGLTAQYYLGQRSDGEWLPYLRTASGQVLDTCQPPVATPCANAAPTSPVRSGRCGPTRSTPPGSRPGFAAWRPRGRAATARRCMPLGSPSTSRASRSPTLRRRARPDSRHP